MHSLRKISRRRQSDWWGRLFDEIIFIYLSGARGINAGFLLPTGWTGCANNSLQSPDSDHLLVPNGHVKATLVVGDTMNLGVIDRAVATVQAMGGETEEIPAMQPISINGEEHYVCVMAPWQAHDLRTSTTTGGWLDVQKAAAAATGKNSPIFKGGMGMHNNVVLQSHKSVIRFSDYGASSNIEAARALFLGEQAGVIAFGSPGSGMRFDWNEESRDNGNQAVITTSAIWGFKKTNFNGVDFGLLALDTAATAS